MMTTMTYHHGLIHHNAQIFCCHSRWCCYRRCWHHHLHAGILRRVACIQLAERFRRFIIELHGQVSDHLLSSIKRVKTTDIKCIIYQTKKEIRRRHTEPSGSIKRTNRIFISAPALRWNYYKKRCTCNAKRMKDEQLHLQQLQACGVNLQMITNRPYHRLGTQCLSSS